MATLSTESEWNNFLNSRYCADTELRNNDWRPPQINTFWEQGPIGVVSSWWKDESDRKFVDKDKKDYKNEQKIFEKKSKQKSKREKMIKCDIMKELKQQKLQKKLRERIESGQIVANLDDSNNPFESFFTSALAMVKTEKKPPKKKEKKTKIIRAKEKKLKKNIASFEEDGLFFFDDDDESESEIIKEPEIAKKEKKRNGIVSSDILSGKNWEDSLREKKVLKRLNVMDFVHNFKDSFFREVEELSLNTNELLKNWKSIKKNEGISRKLRLKLGIIMARERKKQKKELNRFLR